MDNNSSNVRVRIRKLGLNMTTDQGPYWAQIDGQNIGVDGRSHWQTEEEALAAAEVWLKQEQQALASRVVEGARRKRKPRP